MLHTCAPGGHVPLWRGPLLQPESPAKPRQNIVDIVQQCDNTPGVTTFLYEIRRQRNSLPNRGTSFVAKSSDKEKLKQIELKIFHNNENSQSYSFPVVQRNKVGDNVRYSGRTDKRQINSHEQIHEPIKRTREKHVYETKTRPKSVRFSFDKTKLQDASGSSSLFDSKSSSKKTDLSCEVCGNELGVDKDQPRTSSPSHVRAADAIRRQNSFQSSLQLFRRRLRLNQEKFIQAAITRANEEDYLTRHSKPDRQQTVIYPSPPQESRQMAPQSSRPRLRVKYPQLNHKQQQNVTGICDEDAKFSHRLSDSKDTDTAVGVLERSKTSVANVKPCVMEDNSNMFETKTDHILPLTMHNLAVHQTLTSKPENKVMIGNEEVTCEPWFINWLRESNNRVELQHKKSVTFEVSGKKVGIVDSCGEMTLSNRSRVSSCYGL